MSPKKQLLPDLRKHVKIGPPKGEKRTTSVSLTKEHLDFLHANNLNLSSFLRAKLDELMKGK